MNWYKAHICIPVLEDDLISEEVLVVYKDNRDNSQYFGLAIFHYEENRWFLSDGNPIAVCHYEISRWTPKKIY